VAISVTAPHREQTSDGFVSASFTVTVEPQAVQA
jgi:hypothetical protein